MTCIKDGATTKCGDLKKEKYGNLKKEKYGNKSCPVGSLGSS